MIPIYWRDEDWWTAAYGLQYTSCEAALLCNLALHVGVRR